MFPFQCQNKNCARLGAIQTITWLGSVSLMGPILEGDLGAGLNEGLIRHLIVWENLHFQGLNMDMVF